MVFNPTLQRAVMSRYLKNYRCIGGGGGLIGSMDLGEWSGGRFGDFRVIELLRLAFKGLDWIPIVATIGTFCDWIRGTG